MQSLKVVVYEFLGESHSMMSPLRRVIICWHKDSPIPVPDRFVVKNGTKMVLSVSAGIGVPLLLMYMLIC